MTRWFFPTLFLFGATLECGALLAFFLTMCGA